jgi:hypothetical protein
MQSQTPVVKAIHDAVASGNLREAERLLDPYRQQVVADWRAAKTDGERQTIAADVNALLEWARVTTLSNRTHAQNKLVLLRSQSEYSPGASASRAFNLEA